MGELIRRLDYERRSKQRSLLRGDGCGQRINKEYSATVRAANDLEERKKELFILEMEKHKKLFLDRFVFEKKTVVKIKNELDTKSKAFNASEFLELRRRVGSAKCKPRTTTQGNNGNIGPVTEIIPRQYYRQTVARTVNVKFKCDYSMSSESESSDVDSGSDSDDLAVGPLRQVSKWSQIDRRPSSELIDRRRKSYAEFIQQTIEAPAKCLPAKNTRRLSAPPRIMSAYTPGDVACAPSSRRSSRCSTTSCRSEQSMSSNDVNSGNDESESASRSFRLLRQTYKKKKKEYVNQRLEMLKHIKEDHSLKTKDLVDKTKERFKELLSEYFFVKMAIPQSVK